MRSNNLIPELICQDIRRSLHFYVDILGFKILYQRPEDQFVMLDYEGAQVMIEGQVGRKWITGELTPPYGRGINFQIVTSDVDGLCAKITQAGVPVFQEMEEKWYRADNVMLGNKQFLIQDPDGYLLRFFEDLGSKSVGSDL